MTIEIYPKLRRKKILYHDTVEGDATKFTVDASSLGLTLSTAVWSVDSGTATIGTATTTNDISTAIVTTPDSGSALILVLLTFSDGQIINQYIQIRTTKPSNYPSTIWGIL